MSTKLPNTNKNMEKMPTKRWILLVFLVWILCIIVTLAITLAIGDLLAPKRPKPSEIPDQNGGANISIAYPSSTNICVGGCQPHQNWIEFYLPSGGYLWYSVRLKTTLFPGQILTVGIAATPCMIQDEFGLTCVHMQLRHTLLRILTELDIIPISQLRDTGNWWLEYKRRP